MPATASFVDVGQGNCTWAVDDASGEGLLIDCPLGRAADAIGEAATLGVARLTAAFASHNDLDHIGAVMTLARHFAAGAVYYNHGSILPADPLERRKLRAVLREAADLADLGIASGPALRGDHGRVGAIEWMALAPLYQQVTAAQASGDPNHASMVIRLAYGGVRLLISGDADAASWDLMRRDGCDLRAEVLQVPHHGARLESSGEVRCIRWLLEAVSPSDAIVSAGEGNRYGHPDVSVVDALEERRPDRRWWCTCPMPMLMTSGTVHVRLDGGGGYEVGQP